MAAVDDITANTQALTTPDQRTAWNGMLDKLNGQLVTPESIADHAQANPGFSITPEMIPQIQQEHADIRTGDSFGNLTGDQLNAARAGMSPNFINQTDLSNSKYPEFKVGSQNFGTDIEGYANSKIGLATTSDKSSVNAPAPTTAPNLPIDAPGPPTKSNVIPSPDYTNQASRNKFLQNWGKQYGDLQGRGDTVLRVNDIPRGGSDTMKNITTKMGNKYGVDPALLYSSTMEEGASGLFKNLDGTDTKGRKPGEFGYQDFYGDKQFPINGGQSFGFQTFAERFPDLVKGGYLPKEFANQFRGVKAALGSDAEYADANNFKTPEAAIQAKAAMMKYAQDYVKGQAQKNNINLSPKAQDFFTLAWFNGGEGGVNRRLVPYSKNGLLQDDKFLSQRPAQEESVKNTKDDVWGHIVPRMKMRDNLKEQQQF
jgi:hypothetical protein